MNKLLSMAVAALLSSSMLWAGPKLTEETMALLHQAKGQTTAVTAEVLSKEMKNGNVVLIDVRDPDEWEQGTITHDKLVKISRGFLEVKYPKLILDQYSKNDNLVVYCALEPRSVFAAQRLQQLGFSKVRYLTGGLKHWHESGFGYK